METGLELCTLSSAVSLVIFYSLSTDMLSDRPIVIEVPHCASIRDREREVVVLRSDNGQTWREHVTPVDDTPLKDTPTNPTGDILGQYT